MKMKRILAIAALILIVVLYGATLVFSLIDSPLAESFLLASLFCTIVVPAVIYGYFVAIRYFRTRKKDS